jgi:hypothetical protein
MYFIDPEVRRLFLYEIADLRKRRSNARATATDHGYLPAIRAIARAQANESAWAILVIRRIWADMVDIERRRADEWMQVQYDLVKRPTP